MSLPVWLPVPCSFRGYGVTSCLATWSCVHSRGGCLWEGGLLQRMVGGLTPDGGLPLGVAQTPPPPMEPEKWEVRILLECFLVIKILLCGFNIFIFI